MDFLEECKNYSFYEPAEEITTFAKAVEALVEHPDHIVKYVVEKNFDLQNIDVDSEINGESFFDHPIPRSEADVVSNFRCSEKFLLPITCSSKRYIFLCANMYTPLSVRIFVDDQRPEIVLKYDAFLLPNKLRGRMRQ
jgi:hypothetical protein